MSIWRPKTIFNPTKSAKSGVGLSKRGSNKTLICLGNKSWGGRFIFQTCMTYFFTGSWHATDCYKMRLEKRVPLLRISLGDLRICPFGGRKPFSNQPNGQIQDRGFSKILALQERKALVFQEHKLLVLQEHGGLQGFQDCTWHARLEYSKHACLEYYKHALPTPPPAS